MELISTQTALAFFAASVLLALVPGPDNVFVLLHAAVHGARAGLLVVLGLCAAFISVSLLNFPFPSYAAITAGSVTSSLLCE